MEPSGDRCRHSAMTCLDPPRSPRRREELRPRHAGELAAASEVGETSVSSDASAKPASILCAMPAGFKERRDVADAALVAAVVWCAGRSRCVTRSISIDQELTGSTCRRSPAAREAGCQGAARYGGGAFEMLRSSRTAHLANGISFGDLRQGGQHAPARLGARTGSATRVQSAGGGHRTVIEEYVIKARAGGMPTALDAAWTAQFPEKAIRIVDCG